MENVINTTKGNAKAKGRDRVFYWPNYQAASLALKELRRVGDADLESRVNSFGRGYAIQKQRSGRYWGEVSHQCPSGDQYVAGGWV